MIQTNIQYEYTDTFYGEPNYCWVKRGTIETKPAETFSDSAAIRRVKKALGLSGVRCKVASDCDSITLWPCGSNTVVFITFYPFGSAS